MSGITDVSYSGTVLHDLNSLFVSKAGDKDDIFPPAMHLYLVATNANYENNRRRAYPYVQFSSQTVLPSSQLPEDLLASFSWLEFFFKHRTLKPILRFIEHDGGIYPELRHDAPQANPIPTDRVLSFAASRDEDIVLLWMAAVNLQGELVEPVIERFSNPDPETIAQMENEFSNFIRSRAPSVPSSCEFRAGGSRRSHSPRAKAISGFPALWQPHARRCRISTW